MWLPRVREKSAGLVATTWTCLVAVICAAVTPAPCDKTRRIFTESSGIITDGPTGSNYTQDSHCEWLIKARNSSQYITLNFIRMGTECSYDYVFVYDGDSFNSPLLGSFSGNTEPQQVTASSGFMLVLLYSDTNYVLDGFKAEFSVHNCPNNCSKRGLCVGGKCVCEGEWGGRDCSVELCPLSCSGHGQCRGGRCQCYKGYSGEGCTLKDVEKDGNQWHWLSRTESGLRPRAAHSAVYVNVTDSLYVFGGYNLNDVLDSLQVYRFRKSQWEDEFGNVLGHLSSDQVDENLLREVLTQGNLDGRWQLGNRSSFFNQLLLSSISHGDNSHFGIFHDAATTPYSEKVINLDNKQRDFNEDEEHYNITSAEIDASKPLPRYGHAACGAKDGFVLYGGKLASGALSSELWYFNALEEEWTLRALNSNLTPPGLTRHTLTAIDDELYVFGGSTIEGEFSSGMFRIKLTSPKSESWEEVKVRGGKELDVRVVAHTAVYHSYSHSILVYGGVVAGVARFSKLSDRMFAFDIDNKHWSELHYPRAHLRDTYVPRERAFHTSTIIGNYLVVFGGYSHRHNREEICYDGQMYLYHLGCHAWIPLEVLGKPNRYPKKQGVFAHAAALRPPSTLLIAGGYHGNVNGDLLAFVVPTWQGGITSMDSEAACPKHKTDSECLADPECGWCSVDGICYGRTIGSNCTTNLQSVRCGGICPALGDCHSCLIHGPSPAALAAEHLTSPRKPLPSISTKLGLHQCTWCVQNARCHHKDDNYGVCGEDTPSQSPGWWGATGTEVTSPSKCRELDRRPGLTFIRYQQPADRNYPDGVTIVNATTVDWVPGGHNFNILSGPSEARLKGWLRIPESWSGAGEKLQVCAGFANVSLLLGEEGGERVAAKLVAEPADCSPVDWPNLSAGRISVDLFANDSLSTRPFTSHQQSKMELQHNKSNENLKVFTFEYLEPYSNGSCSANNNCLLCLADAACGWCELTNKCESRDSDEQISCRQADDWRYLTLQPSACPNCSNYINCERCVNSGLCEWWADEARCSRLGRALNATTSIDDCPVPCKDRVDCTQCLDDRGRCVWCEATQQCFSFSVYTSEYQFGLCREWLDRASPLIAGDIDTSNVHRADQCKSCSSYTNCSACLQNLGCGWCYSEDNPIHGACTQGDFTRAYTECHTLLGTNWDETLWAYAQCPDVDECGLGLHDCHKNAICNNTHGSYSCKCRKGYIGDGRTSCTQTCYNSCIHGYCLGQPDFVCQCDLGWTGVDCSQNCGCHNHSTCRAGIGFCDECKDWTEGEYCERCKPGSYGNATSSQGCRRCDCNDHGDETLGVCDIDTGVCICKDNTEGPNCEKCSGDYYGDPRHGQRCYYHCEARGMLKGSFEKGIGSFKSHSSPWGSPPTKECLWIISSEGLSSNNAIIQFSINNTKLNVSCDDNAVYVYDGIIGVPELGIGQQSQLIGVFCKDISPGTVEAFSGNLTVHYKQGPVGQGFEGVYKILMCDKDCVSPRRCEKGQCVCNDNLTGPNCEIELCSNNCTSYSQQGVCDRAYGRCLCLEGWGGPDCSVKIEKHQLIFTELFNTTHLAEHFDHLRKTLPRFGHSLVADRRGLWMFGGYSLSHGPLNDIRLFDTKNNTWMQVTVEATPDAKMPAGRYFHAAEISHPKQIIYIYGGLRVQEKGLENKTLHDFWQFSLKDQRWSMVMGEEEQPPPLAGHTLTYQKNQIYESLVLIGGFSLEKGFLPDIWEFNLGDNKWKKLSTNGSKPIGICGHSTVYHAPTQSLYIFGGILFTINGTIVSNKLFSLHYPSLQWSELPTFPILNDPMQNLPRPSYLHSAVTTNEYMIVFGGRADTATETDILTAYVYNCNQWIRLLEHSEVVGIPPLPTIAHAMTLDYDPENGRNSTIYIVGGWTGGAQCQVTRVTIPEDLCQLWHQNKYTCRAHMACSFCSSNGANECYSYEKTGCEGSNSTIRTSGGLPCDGKFIASRTCSNFTTCGTCLAAWPAHPEGSPVCQWCESCGRGQCLSIGEDCLRLGQKCEMVGISLTNDSLCVDSVCTASDCEKCSSDYCVWTRQVINEGNGPKIHDDPIYNWTCTSKEGLGRSLLRLRHFEKCPVRCHYHQDCRSCLRSDGAEGGFSECRWATHLNKCLGPAYQPLYCAGGVCGLVLSSDEIEQCPSPCMSFEQCAECLRHAHCGWCSRDGASGDGICTEGSMESPFNYPAQSTCEVLYGTRNNWQEPYPNDTFTWNYIKCPPENECENGHHNCDPVSERCEDLPLGYQCVCGPGHKLAGAACLPVCSQGCVRGNCIQPDVCECDFGYVGANCSIQCQCNGHANCEGPDKLNHCLECHNNTMGKQCEKCKPLFVGDPTDYGTCTPCSIYCHGHTTVCMSETSDLPLPSHEMSKHDLEDYFGEGPTIRARCVRCANNTDGSRCDKCIEGHFRGSEDYRDPCRPCECHGHGDICDPVTGEKCNCGNNTESELSCQTSSSSKNSAQECWRFQCVKCKDLYMGDPKNGHQCYKIMSADNKMCFDAKSIDDCKLKPGPLHPGQTVFFVVIPRFMNVDIRVIVDVTQGAVDLFMSPNDSSFVVSVNTSTGAHYVDLDPSYFKHDPFRGTDSFSFDDNHYSRPFDGNIEYILADYKAGDLATFVTVDKRDTLLRIRDLRNRLVLTIPQSVHNLQFTKFYLVLRALPTEEGSASYGMVFFRQDQLHIDLFVFFSVFFSCFFLFLAACVVAWKAKQAADVRRARRRHVVEMLHMAKRPFAMVTIVLSGGPASVTNSSGGRRRRKTADVRPVAVEPTCDGVAAVTSVLVRLPGGKSAPVRLALASSLVLLARQSQIHNRPFLRRRSIPAPPPPT